MAQNMVNNQKDIISREDLPEYIRSNSESLNFKNVDLYQKTISHAFAQPETY